MNKSLKELLDTEFTANEEGILVGSFTLDRINEIADYITNLQKKLEVSQTNEETYRLEMLDITKCLGLDKDTIFDEAKEKATNLQKENERLLHIAKKMHTFIFLNTDNEQEAYDKLGLTEEENIMLGYSGQIIITGGDNNE